MILPVKPSPAHTHTHSHTHTHTLTHTLCLPIALFQVVVNDSLSTCVQDLQRLCNLSRTSPQWVPLEWARQRNGRSQLLEGALPADDAMDV